MSGVELLNPREEKAPTPRGAAGLGAGTGTLAECLCLGLTCVGVVEGGTGHSFPFVAFSEQQQALCLCQRDSSCLGAWLDQLMRFWHCELKIEVEPYEMASIQLFFTHKSSLGWSPVEYL